MKKNIGISDRIIRFVLVDLLLGASLAGIELPLVGSSFIFLSALWLGVTIVTAYSPLYHLVGINTVDESVKEVEQLPS